MTFKDKFLFLWILSSKETQRKFLEIVREIEKRSKSSKKR